MKSFHSIVLSLPLVVAAGVCAQTPSAAPPEEKVKLHEFVITASPLARAADEIVQPASVLGGRHLAAQLEPTLGETLSGEPGISSTYFGPGASRQVIRGLGGDRIRVLSSGVGTLDASVVSPDHAVSVDPIVIDRIETVRGPATLLYGGSAIGGVINIIDSRIPREATDRPVAGRLTARLGSAADEQSIAGVLRGGAGGFAWHLDGFRRETSDVSVPDFAWSARARAEHADDESPRGHIPNTASESSSAAAGVSWITDLGRIGLGYSGLDTLYGVPGTDHGAVRIDLKQRRWDLASEFNTADAWIRTGKFQLGVSDYQHVELEGDEIGTRFANEGFEGRLELLHRKTGPLEGAIGFQASRSDFSATGEEAFLPPTRSESRAIFVFEEIAQADLVWQLGTRLERNEVTPRDSGMHGRAHTAASVAGGVVWDFRENWSVAVSVSRNERSPNAQELFADGPHAGTGSFEIGDTSLGLERSVGLDLTLRRATKRWSAELTVFSNRFDGYIFEEPTDAIEQETELPIYRFVQRDADFRGGEIDVAVHLHEQGSVRQVDVRLTGDYVRGTNTTSDEALPRITPGRLGVALDYRHKAFTASAEIRTTRSQRRTAPDEFATGGFTQLALYASWRTRIGSSDAEVFLRGTNLTDTTARVHTSFLKEIAPLPGRNITAGVKLAF